MKKILMVLAMVAGTLTLGMHDADAKRLGGGGSIGRQSSNVSRQAAPATPAPSYNQQRPAAAPTPTPAPAAAIPPKPASPWKGIVGGLVGGALLGAALSHFGLGGAAAGMLGSLLTFALIGFAIFFVIRLFRGNQAGGNNVSAFQQPAYAGGAASSTPEIGSRLESQTSQSAFNGAAAANQVNAANAATWSVPADFDVPAFLRNAKTYFIRLQAAGDRADINDLREFTSPEMYAELKLEIQERGATPNVTDVVSIDAELLGVENLGNDHLASVKFTGMIKESQNAPAEAFAEVWNLSKPVNGQGGWVLAGIQQL